MPFIISNPLGFLALLGIPAVLLIHFLQRKAQVIPCSTLFLLKQTQKESNSGRKFDRIINSISLWMQLLLVILITLLLIQPRYVQEQSTQRIAIVIDSSASMSVYKEQAKKKILEVIPELQSNAKNVELWILDSNISKDRIYHGNSVEDLESLLDKWEPQSGTANPHHVLRIGRSLCGHDGALVYITDTPVKSIPYNAIAHSIGTSEQNVGFTGVQFNTSGKNLMWQASIRNYSSQPATRTWNLLTSNQQKSEEQSISLAPNELKVIEGIFPSDSERITLALSSDKFTHDNTLPLIKPQSKKLAAFLKASENHTKDLEKITTSFPHIELSATEDLADLFCLSLPPETEKFGIHPAIVFLSSPSEDGSSYKLDPIVATEHDLTEGLNWQKLLISESSTFKLSKRDTPLVWSKDQAIIFIREIPIGLGEVNKQLVFNFDISNSNAFKQECIALLIYRYLEQLRQKKDTLVKDMTELDQPLTLNVDNDGQKTQLKTITLQGKSLQSEEFDPKHPLKAISSVGFFNITQGDNTLLEAASYFADTREADLSQCSTGKLEPKHSASAIDQHSNEDHLWRIWLLISLLALMVSWSFSKEPTQTL